MGNTTPFQESLNLIAMAFGTLEILDFPVHGTLIDTLHQAITQSATGKSNSELEKHCGVKVQTALRTLLCSKKIVRVKLEKKYLYVNADPSTSDRQIRKRIEVLSAPAVNEYC